MAKKRQPIRRRRSGQAPQFERQTNWLVIGGIVVGSLIFLAGLMWLAWRPQTASARSLSVYCADNEGSCITLGSETAPVTIVEVSDYGCPHCRTFNLETAPLLDETYIKTGQVRWLVLPFALGPQTTPTAAATMCAAEQDAFPAFHIAMFEMQDAPDALTRAGFMAAAENLDLDLERFGTCVDSNRYNKTVQDNSQAATRAGVTGTPTFFINDVALEGAHPFGAFQQRISPLLN